MDVAQGNAGGERRAVPANISFYLLKLQRTSSNAVAKLSVAVPSRPRGKNERLKEIGEEKISAGARKID